MNSVLRSGVLLLGFFLFSSVHVYSLSSPDTSGLIPPEPEFKDEMVQRDLSGEYIIEKKPVEGPKVEQKSAEPLGVEIVNEYREGRALLDSLSDACRLGDGSSCHFLAEYYVEQKMPSAAKDYFEKACENKHEESCLKLGVEPHKG